LVERIEGSVVERLGVNKSKIVCLLVTAAIMTVLCVAQSTKPLSSPSKTAKDPLVAATKPITPKSAMPAHPKSAAVLPPATGKNTTAELTHLENQKISTPTANNGSGKGAPVTKRTRTSGASGPAIDYRYQKPVGGKQASTPDANARNSSTPRVKKN
jgi:hypothetical protein